MSVSMNPVSSMNAEEIKSMNFLGQQINNIFNKSTDKTVQITELAKELLGSKKETSQETEVALLASKYSSFIDEKPLKLFAMSLHKLPSNPLEVGLEYIQKAPGYDLVKGFQVPNDWGKNETVTLNQIYKEQFFSWILKNSQLPFNSILVTLHFLKGFDDPSIPLDDKTWDKFLLTDKRQKQLTDKRQKQLKEFQSKYEFLRNNKFLQSFPIELKKITVTCDIQRSIHDQYGLFNEALNWILQNLIKNSQSEEVSLSMAENLLSKDENAWKSFSSKVLMHKLKKMLFPVQERLTSLINYLNQNERERSKEKIDEDQSRLKWLDDSQVEINKVLDICTAKKECISNQVAQSASKSKKKKGRNQPKQANVIDIKQIQEDLMKQYFESEKAGVSELERDAQLNQELHRILNEKMITLKDVQETEDFFNNQINGAKKETAIIRERFYSDRLNLQKKDFSLIYFLINYMNNCLTKEQVSKEKKEGLSLEQFDEMLEREFEPERKISTSKTHKTYANISGVIEEESVQITEPKSADKAQIPSTTQSIYKDLVQVYLENKEKDKQLNGCLSQKIENYLEQIKPLLNQEQGKEVYYHTLLGAAALEHMAQAIYEGRKDHVVLGFRSLLMHCYFSVEQMLSQKIFENTGNIADSHDLSYLANKLEGNIAFSKEENFFKDKVHLWFRYPEDYRLRFNNENERKLQQGKRIKALPKAFSLLEALSRPEISVESVQEAMTFSFEKYCQTLELVVKLTEAPVQNTVDLRNNISDLQNQLLNSLKLKKKSFVKPTPLLNEIKETKAILCRLEKLDQVQDLEKGEFLASLNTIKSYLQYMEISLQTPQKSAVHSLQKFLHAETLLNMDKLFKHLFRAMSILHLEEDNHAHNLPKFYSMVDDLYKGALSEESKKLLKDINLNITHHYFHRESDAGLKENYDRLLRNAFTLSPIPEGFTAVTMNKEISDKTLQEDEKIITSVILSSLQLFNQLLPRVISNIEAINNGIKENLNGLRIV